MVAAEMRKIAGFAVFLTVVNPHPGFAKSAECARAQLEIRQIAQDSPGMNHTNAFFAILNKGAAPCRLSAGYVQISETRIHTRLPEHSPARFILPPLRGGRWMNANDVIGFNVSNDGASGPTRGVHKLYFEFAKKKAFHAKYQGYDTSPFAKRAPIVPFSAWKVFPGDQCMVEQGKALAFTSNPKIDTRTAMVCG